MLLEVILLILGPYDISKHAIRLAHRLNDKLLHCLCELLVAVNAEQPSVDNPGVIFTPVSTLLELGPVPARNTFTRKTFKDEQLARLLVLDKHAHVIISRTGHTPNQLVLHLVAREEENVTRLCILEQL